MKDNYANDSLLIAVMCSVLMIVLLSFELGIHALIISILLAIILIAANELLKQTRYRKKASGLDDSQKKTKTQLANNTKGDD